MVVQEYFPLFLPDSSSVLDLQSLTVAGGCLLSHMIRCSWYRGLAPKHPSCQHLLPADHLGDEDIVGGVVDADLQVIMKKSVVSKC